MCDMLTGTTGGQMSLLPEVKEMTPFGRWEPVSQIPEKCWLLSKCQKS